LNGVLNEENLATIFDLGLKAVKRNTRPINFDTSDALDACEALTTD
jgi:hypothetical protein